MKVNKKKTKVMVCSRNGQKQALDISLDSRKVDEVKESCYLGGKITKYGRSKTDIKCSIAMTKKFFKEKLIIC